MRIVFDALDELDLDEAEAFVEASVAAGATRGSIESAPPLGMVELPAIATAVLFSAGSLSILAHMTLDEVDRFRRAIVVSWDGTDVLIRPERSLPRGTIVLVGSDGASIQLARSATSKQELSALINNLAASQHGGLVD